MAAARCAAMMCAMQRTRTDILCYYDARVGTSIYGGVFNPLTLEPFPLYYAFVAFNELYKLGEMATCSHANSDGIYILAAASDAHKAVLVANESDRDVPIRTNLGAEMKASVINDTLRLEPTNVNASDFTIPQGTVILFKA